MSSPSPDVVGPEPGDAGGVVQVRSFIKARGVHENKGMSVVHHPVLRRFADRVGSDPMGAHAELEAALAAARGPLIAPAGAGRVSVTFVLCGPVDALSPGGRPAVRCHLFPGIESCVPMDLVPGSSDVWWATVNAPDDVSTLYQFQSRLVPVPEGIDKPLHDPEVMSRYVAELTEVGFADPVNPTSFGVEQEVGVEGEEGSGPGRPPTTREQQGT